MTYRIIPKILHYCWLGGNANPYLEFVHRWRELHSDWRIIRWDEHNAPLNHIYLATVISNKMYSKAADFMRLWVLIRFGGIYLDTDVELIRPLYELLPLSAFAGFQREATFDHNEVINSAVLGAYRGHPLICNLFQRLLQHDKGNLPPMESGPRLISQTLLSLGVNYSDDTVEINRGTDKAFSVLPKDVFYPYSWEENFTPDCVTERTIAIHHWRGSWVERWRKHKSANH